MGRIVLFGATGYTGRLTAQALVRRGAAPVLAGRSSPALAELAAELGGGLETATADVARPETVRALVGAGDVLLSTVGPFVRWGAAAAEAAIAAGIPYVDSTGEPPFIRRIFTDWDVEARASGAGLVTAFGYDFVPGNLAGALALERAGAAATGVRVGYFATGDGAGLRGAASGGTIASLAGVLLEDGFAWRGGRIVPERVARRVRSFSTSGGRRRTGVSVAASEHFALPRLAPRLQEVDAYLGWFGPASRGMQAFGLAGSLAVRVPGVGAGWTALARRAVRGSSGGPDAAAREGSGSLAVAEAYDDAGEVLARVELRGPNGYTYTAEMLAWGAHRALEHGLAGTGALGPVEAFGLDELVAGNADAGLVEA